ncbi:hypothetical protein J2W58_000697 [Pseudomonas psychrotolerans]|nr:hypothetical protein [Pseudomonas psychrotolerans]
MAVDSTAALRRPVPGTGATALSRPVMRGTFHTCRKRACDKGPCEGSALLSCRLRATWAAARRAWRRQTPTRARSLPRPPSRQRRFVPLLVQGTAPLRRSGAWPAQCATNARNSGDSRRPSLIRAFPAPGTTLAKALARHRAGCLPYAHLASRGTPCVRLDRTLLSRQIRHKKPDLPVIRPTGTSGFFYSWGESKCTTTSAV